MTTERQICIKIWCIWCGVFGPHRDCRLVVKFGAFGAVSASRTSHHKQLPFSAHIVRVPHRAWTEPGEWLSTTELQSKRSNPNAQRQMGVRKQAAP